jgi:hypothetical protein
VPVIFANPAGAPELACDECGCRWFDRMANRCYECGAPVPEAELAAFRAALADFARRGGRLDEKLATAPGPGTS